MSSAGGIGRVDEGDLIPISALQHFLYCPRQCALIHVERLWAENALTAEGRVLHDRVDVPGVERRKGVRTATAMPIRSLALGIAGVADLVEFHDTSRGPAPFPVEFKRGRPKAHRVDEVQLCAQALCLEEMLDVTVSAGALFYGRTRRRHDVAFDQELRALTRAVAAATRELLSSGRTPPAVYEPKRCEQCSLIELCRPKALQRQRAVPAWLARLTEA